MEPETDILAWRFTLACNGGFTPPFGGMNPPLQLLKTKRAGTGPALSRQAEIDVRKY
jgi:hypothetical protein